MKRERIRERKKNKKGKEEKSPDINTTANERINPIKKTLKKDITLSVIGCQGSKSRCAISICLFIFSSSAAETFSFIMLPRLLHHRSYLEISGAISALNFIYDWL